MNHESNHLGQFGARDSQGTILLISWLASISSEVVFSTPWESGISGSFALSVYSWSSHTYRLGWQGGNIYHRQNGRLRRRDILAPCPQELNHLAFLIKFHADMCEDAKGCIFSCPWLKAVILFSSADTDLVWPPVKVFENKQQEESCRCQSWGLLTINAVRFLEYVPCLIF